MKVAFTIQKANNLKIIPMWNLLLNAYNPKIKKFKYLAEHWTFSQKFKLNTEHLAQMLCTLFGVTLHAKELTFKW